MVLEKKIFEGFPYIFLCETKFTPGRSHLDPGGHDLNNLGRGPLDDALCQISKLWALWFWRRRFLKSCTLKPPFGASRPYCAMDRNHLNNFDRASPKQHSCEVSLKLAQCFRRRCLLNEKLTHGRTHARTHGRTDDGRRTKGDHKSSPCHYVTGELKIYRRVRGAIVGRSTLT